MLEIGNPLKFTTLRDLSRGGVRLALTSAAAAAVDRGAAAVAGIVRRGQPAYGVNTGFGRLAQTHIPNDQLELLQRNLVLSHAVGVGEPLPAGVVRLMLALKIQALSRGYSGVRRELIDALVRLYNADVLPRVPSKGSVGASGDLAPLAHLSAVLLGIGEVECEGRVMPAPQGLERAGLKPVTLAAKEGLALLNGTQTSTALALWHLFAIDNLYATALVAGALSVDAAEGSASGLGDLIVRVKSGVLRQASQGLAAGIDVRLPTGDERNLLGSGAPGVRPFLAYSASHGRLSPHVNFSYAWNGSSVLAGDPATGVKADVPDQFQYAIGADLGVTDKFSVVVDWLGREVIDSPRVRLDTRHLVGPYGAEDVPDIVFDRSSFWASSAALGFKTNAVGRLLVDFNLRFTVGDNGLTDRVTPLLGIEYTF